MVSESEGKADQHLATKRQPPLERFRALFFSRSDCFGRAVGNDARCEKAAVTDDVLLAHLRGEIRIGAYPTNAESCVLFGAVDIDSEGHEKKPLTPAEKHSL